MIKITRIKRENSRVIDRSEEEIAEYLKRMLWEVGFNCKVKVE